MSLEVIEKVIINCNEVNQSTKISVKQGNHLSNIILASIFIDDTQINLDNLNVRYVLLRPDGTQKLADATIFENQAKITLTENDLAYPGVCKCQIILSENDNVLNTSNLYIKVVPNFLDEDKIINTDEHQSLFDIITKADEKIKNMTNLENTVSDNENARVEAEEERQTNFENIKQTSTQIFQEHQTQTQYAKEQGDYAKEQGDAIKGKGDFATQQGNYAKEQGNYAKEQGDFAKEQGELISQLNISEFISATNQSISDLETKSENTNSQIGDINESVQNANSQIITINSTLDSTKSQISTINSTLDSTNSQISTIKNTIKNNNIADTNWQTLKEWSASYKYGTYYRNKNGIVTLRADSGGASGFSIPKYPTQTTLGTLPAESRPKFEIVGAGTLKSNNGKICQVNILPSGEVKVTNLSETPTNYWAFTISYPAN